MRKATSIEFRVIVVTVLALASTLGPGASPAAAPTRPPGELAFDCIRDDCGRPQTLEEMLRERYQSAVESFTSLDHDEAIELFTSVIDFLESQAQHRDLQHNELVMMGSSHFYRAAAMLDIGADEDEVRDDLLSSFAAVTDPRDLEIDLDLVSPKLIDLFNEVQEGSVARLLVVPDPSSAEVLIDNRPALLSLDGTPVLAGTHTITVRHLGFREASETVTVSAGEKRNVYVPLEARVLTFSKVDFFVTEGEKKDARVEVDYGRSIISFSDEKNGTSRATYAQIPADKITSMSYREADSPMVTDSVPGVSQLVSELQGLWNSKSHWLTVEFLDDDGLESIVYIRLHKDNFLDVIAAIESCSGRDVDGIRVP